jgi:ketosteroid isomerase-like protein
MGVSSGSLQSVEAETIGDTIIEIGRAELVMTGGVLATVKYVVVWKQEDGRWKWHIDIWNPNA